MAAAGDLAALSVLGGGTAVGGGQSVKRRGVSSEESEKKRQCLRHYDLPPAQLLNSMGMSGIEKIPTEKLWELCKKGNAKVEAFSNLCFESKERRNVGLSQGCEVVAKAIERLENCPEVALVVKPDVLANANAEGAALKPHLQLLNQGKTSRNGLSSMRNVAYFTGEETAADPQKIKVAADKVHEWLSSSTSVLRALIVLLSSGGLFFAAHCHEKTMRAFIEHGGGDKLTFVEAALGRAPQITGGDGEMAALGGR